MSSIAASKLFEPIKIGNMQLQHRIVQAPLTRFRANKDHVHGDLAVEYYGQRASTPGTMIITEATFVSAEAAGYDNVPGIWSDEQISAWKRVTDAVHSKGSFIVLQLWALGRAATEDVLARDGFKVVGPSAIAMEGGSVPHPLSKEDIARFVSMFAQGAKNAIAAGFDGVEVHAANGYLLDNFLQDVSNNRTDEFGGSIENRARFPLQVLDAVVNAVGEERTAIRFSPWSRFQSMLMDDPIPTFKYVTEQIAAHHPNLMYLHFVESRVKGDNDDDTAHHGEAPVANNEYAREIWAPRPFISAGGYSNAVDSAVKAVEERGVVTAWGRAFIANPDLPLRLKKGIPLARYNRDTFYIPESPVGYTDQAFAPENVA